MKFQIHLGDAREVLRTLPDQSANCCVTSPPYWGLRDYGVPGQLGLETDPNVYVGKLVDVFREVRRVLRDDGTLWLNLGDSYAGSWGAQGRQGKSGALAGRTACAQRQIACAAKKASNTGTIPPDSGLKPKDLVGIPWRVAFALQADGWYLRSDIIWHKPNPMPESVTDRPTKAHEYIFLLAKSERYFYDAEAVKEPFADARMGNPGRYKAKLAECKPPGGVHGKGVTGHGWNHDGSITGRNRRTVWTVTTKPFKGAHFATFPPDLIEPCIKAGCPVDGVVLDPFFGAGTTGVVAKRLGRNFIGIELNPQYVAMAQARIDQAHSQAELTEVT